MTSTEDLNVEMLRRGIVETHYHIGPEILARRYDVAILASLAREYGATIVLKNHTYSTTPLAALARRHYEASLCGGIVLNHFVGGLNPDAVTAAALSNKADVQRLEPDDVPVVVWMPTVHATAHLEVMGHAFDPRWSGCCTHPPDDGGRTGEAPPAAAEAVRCFDEDLAPVPELLAVLDAVAEHGCVLATGHLAAEEVMRLVPLALSRGVPRIILTHPHYPSIELSDQQIADLTQDERVFAEHCFAIHTIEEVPLERFATAISASPPGQVILSTDFGQIVSDPFPDGTTRYARELWTLLQSNFTEEDFLAMFTSNPRRALGLPPAQKTEVKSPKAMTATRQGLATSG